MKTFLPRLLGLVMAMLLVGYHSTIPANSQSSRFNEDTILAMEFSPDGSKIAVSVGMSGITILDGQTLTPVQSWVTPDNSPILELIWHPTSPTLIATGDLAGNVQLWDVSTGTLIRTVVTYWTYVSGLFWVDDGAILGSSSNASPPDNIYLHEVTSGAIVAQMSDASQLEDAIWIKAGNIIATGRGVRVQFWDASDRTNITLLSYIEPEIGAIGELEVDPVSGRVAIAGVLDQVKVYDPNTTEFVLTYRGHAQTYQGISTVKWSPDGQFIASLSTGNVEQVNQPELHIWDALTGDNMLVVYPDVDTRPSFAWHPGSVQLAWGSTMQNIQIVDTAVPSAPTNLAVTSSSPVGLSWQDNSVDEDGFIVSRQVDGGDWQDIATLPADTTTYTDVACGALAYRVRATRTSPLPLDSIPSNEVSVSVGCE